MTRMQFIVHLENMPFSRLVDYIYWDNHGGDNMDIEPNDWTIAMVLDVLAGEKTDHHDWNSFDENYARFLRETDGGSGV